jgi:pimeloyl-ACP methyl ester carboxylesterase
VKNPRIYGEQPYRVAVVHGGPGALGSVAPVARELARDYGMLEPLQTATTIDEQVDELAGLLREHGDGPATLIGHSWGAWLAYLVAARHPSLVRKLILVSSGPFEAHYAAGIMDRRFSNLPPDECTELKALMAAWPDFSDADLSRLGHLSGKADTYDPLPSEPDPDPLPGAANQFETIWPEADAMRANGELLRLARDIACPVTAIHGDYDSHPADGVREPLERVLSDFRFILLERCGHEPWSERWARDAFFSAVREEITE